MNAESHASPSASIRFRIRNFVVGIWLVVFCYAAIFYIVMCTIAAYQVQARAAALAKAPARETELPRDSAEVSGSVLIVRAQTQDSLLRALEAQWNRIEENWEEERVSGRSEYWDILDPLVQKTGLYTVDLYDPADYESIRDSLVTSVDGGTPLDSSELAHFDSTLADYRDTEPARQREEALWSAREETVQQLARAQAADSAFSPYVEDIRVEIQSLRITIAGWEPISFAPFVSAPESVLVFLLAIAMGALGSTIHITRAFLAGESWPMAWYLIRPLLGTVTAVAIYILAKAGQLALNPGAAAGPMDPWFISFLAIISGLMSEDAVRRISDAGKTFFETTSHDRPDRWGLNLGEKMAEAETDRAPLAAALGVPVSRLDSWADATEPVPADAQEVIAAWLRQPVREVFSDMAPGPAQAPPE